MKGEINRDFYCSQGKWSTTMAIGCPNEPHCFNCCSRHRKWPMPEQYKEEYGEEYPEGGAVYMNDDGVAWWASSLTTAKMFEKLPREVGRSFYVVCACTPFGPPPYDWRPE